VPVEAPVLEGDVPLVEVADFEATEVMRWIAAAVVAAPGRESWVAAAVGVTVAGGE
jgi:hypothetical protein